MATTQAFLKETVLQNRFIRPGVVKVVLHVDGPLEDGSMVKEVADSTVYMKAIFTQQSLDTFHTSFEDSFNSPPEWSQALLLLNQFHVEFQPASLPSNTEKRPRFVLMVERFGLYNLHEGFYSKNQPKDLMADPDVQAKAEEMEKDFVSGQDEDVHSQDCSDVAVSVLLEQMGQSSIGDLTAIVSQCEQEDSNPTEPRRDAVNIVHTWQSALDKMRCLDLEDFMVSAEEQAVLDSVPEWKDSYMPPASDSSDEQQWKTSMGMSLDIAFEGPTLQQESCQALRHIPPTRDQHTPGQEDNSTKADNRKTEDIPAGTDDRKTKDIPVGTVNRKVKEVPTGNEESASVCKETDANSLTTSAAHAENRAAKAGEEEEEGSVVVVEPDTEAEKRLTGEKGPAHSQPPSVQHDSAAWQPAPDCLGSSTSSLDSSAHQPDLSFTISSMSNCENSTSLGEDPSSVCADAACQPAEPFSPSCEVHDAAAAGAVHESQNDKQQRQNQLNTDFATGDKAENGLTVTSLHIACQSASADSTNLDREKGSDVSTTQPEQVKRVESGAVKMTNLGNERNMPGVELRDKQSCSGDVQSFDVSPPISPRSCVAENEKSSDGGMSGPSSFTVPAAQQFVPSDPTSQLWLASQAFVPSNMLTQDMIPDDAQESQSIDPPVKPTHNLTGDDLSFAGEDTTAEAREGGGDRQLAAPTVDPVTACDETHGKSERCTVRCTAEGGGNGMSSASEMKQATECSTSHICFENTLLKEHQSNQVNICSDLHLVEESPDDRIHHSTQNVSSDGSQSPSVLEMSPIQRNSAVEKRRIASVTRTNKTELIRPTDREQGQGRDQHQNNRLVTRSQHSRNREQTSSHSPLKISKHSEGSLHETPESANAVKVLVRCSGSSDSEDPFDRELMLQAIGREVTKHTNIHPCSSSGIVVVPDSSQEDVIMISSSGGSSVVEACGKPSEIEAQTVGELRGHVAQPPHNNMRRRDCLEFVDTASTRKTNCQLSPSKGSSHQESRTTQPPVARNNNFSSTMHKHTGFQKTKPGNNQLRKDMKKTIHEGEKDSSRNSEDTRTNKQTQGQGLKPVRVTDRDNNIQSRSGSDASEDEHSEQRMTTSSRKRQSPWASNHSHLRKQAKQKGCEDTRSNYPEGRPAFSRTSDLNLSYVFRLGDRNNTYHQTLSEDGAQPSTVVNRQTGINATHHRKQSTLHRFGMLRPVRSKEMENTARKTQSDSRQTNSHAVHSTYTNTHAPRPTRGRNNVCETSAVSVTHQHKHNASTEGTDTSSDEDVDTVRAGFHRHRGARSKHGGSITAASRSDRDHHAHYSKDRHVSQHSSTSTYTDHLPNTARRHRNNNTKQNHGTEISGAFGKRGKDTASSQHSCDDNSSDSPSALCTFQPLRPGPSRNACTKTLFARLQQLDSSETEEQTDSETESSRGDTVERMRTNFSAWLEYRARSEDPKQKRLRQLKLTEDLLRKVEECLSSP